MKTILYIIAFIVIISVVISKPKESFIFITAYILYLFALTPIVTGDEHDFFMSIMIMIFDEKWHFLLFLAIAIFGSRGIKSNSS